MRKKLVGLLIIFGLVAFLLPTEQTIACTPPVGGLPFLTIADRVELAPIVLEGAVVDILGNDWNQIAIVEVASYYKGNGPARMAIDRFGPGSLCLSFIAEGGPYIIYVTGDEDVGYRAFYASQFDAYIDAYDESRAEVIAATGQDATLPDPDLAENMVSARAYITPTTEEVSSSSLTGDTGGDESSLPLALIFAVNFLLVMGLLVFFLMRRGR